RFAAAARPFLHLIATPDPTTDPAATLTLGDLVEPGREPPALADAEETTAAEHALDPYVAGGVIDEDERFILLAVHLYARTLGDVASELGITREAAKKRHQRALERLRDLRRTNPPAK
ncbi:MAG: sigma factor-like helix-turn-helix DNA-binding protein, partial [Myxococcota bacterium]|nr:sigma factor-like helix-turn-helix DNA-binding protein [Myxococcota bacterium]